MASVGVRLAGRLPDEAVASHDEAMLPGARRARVTSNAQRSDIDAFERLYRVHAPAVHALCRRMLGNDGNADELVQDIFVRAWEKLPGFRGESSVGTWLHRLGVNVILDFLRGARRDALRFAGDDMAAESTTPDAVSSDDIVARLDLESALTRLAGGARAVLVMHDIEGYSHEEIAQMTGIAAGTSRAQLWRARRQLARMLDP